MVDLHAMVDLRVRKLVANGQIEVALAQLS